MKLVPARLLASAAIVLGLTLTTGPTASAYPFASAQQSASATAQPVIAAQPRSVAASVTRTAPFAVRAVGTNLTYFWQRALPGKGWVTIAGANGSSYGAYAVPGVNKAQYRVVVRNAGGQVISSPATLIVVTPVPKISSQPASVHVVSGQTATYAVTASGYALSYRWQSKLPGRDWLDIPGATRSSYGVPALVGRSVYLYRAVITNPGGRTISAPAGLAVDSTRTDSLRAGTATNLSNWRVMAKDTISDAWPLIQRDNLGPAPAAGYRYVAVFVGVRYLGSDAAYPWVGVDVSFVGGNGRTYQNTTKVHWANNIYSLNELYHNATSDFATIVEIPAAAVAAGKWKITDHSDYSSIKTAWFSLH